MIPDSTEIINTILQSLLTSGFIGVIAYFFQRHHKLLDGYKIEKNKALLQSTIEAENGIYNVFMIVRSQYFISENELINCANSINRIRLEKFLYISDKIYLISKNFADYLLEVAESSDNRSRFKEEEFAEKFKKEFRK